jgi:hypothetical protein
MTEPVKRNEETGEPIKLRIDSLSIRIALALECAQNYGQIDGDHHKMWVIDQMVRVLNGSNEQYEQWVKEANDGDDGPDTYSWDTGVAP